MKTAIYIVIYARDSWWVDLDGESDGPFGTLDVAIQQAIDQATATAAKGGRSEVRVTGPGQDNALVYQSRSKGLLARAVAQAPHHQR